MPQSAEDGLVLKDLWEDELELPVGRILSQLESDSTRLSAWVASRTGRQLEMLCRVLSISDAARLKQKRDALAQCNGGLTPYYLTDQFARRKGKFAVADLASAVLAPELLDLCKGKDPETFDTRALLYALLHASPEHLKTLFHLDKIHKSGFARMTLKQKTRQPITSFEAFLTRERARQVLEAFDKRLRDQRQSQLKNVFRHNHHHLVFIRRPERPQHIISDGRIHHGHRVEWIILDFADNARRVNISSNSNEVPLQIANAIASTYFERAVEYDNESEVTYEKQIHVLLDLLKAGTCEGLNLTDLEVQSSPIDGVDLRVSHDAPEIVQRAVAALERDHGSLTQRLDRITKLKVVYQEKRIDLRFERIDAAQDEFIVRYMDSRLNASLRKQFEDFMRDTHGIPILTTEKRFARH